MAATYDGRYFVEHVVHGQWSSFQRDEVIKLTTQLDNLRYGLGQVRVFFEQEPGSAGKDAVYATAKLLAGNAVRPDKVTGSKVLRAEAFAAQCEAQTVFLVSSTDQQSPWIKNWIDEIIEFPDGPYADQADASSGAFNMLIRQSVAQPAVGGGGGNASQPGAATPYPSSASFQQAQPASMGRGPAVGPMSGLRDFRPQ